MSKKPKWQRDRDRWIEDTQMFQRIARVAESSYEELAEEWKKMNTKKVKQK
jgi:hypothetical protein